jgi:hypothetical protein
MRALELTPEVTMLLASPTCPTKPVKCMPEVTARTR